MFVNLLLKFISVDSISAIIAKLIAKLLKYASKHGGEKWTESKKILQSVSIWINLFNEVYKDDELTAEEEAMIAEAIKNQTNVKKIVDILKG